VFERTDASSRSGIDLLSFVSTIAPIIAAISSTDATSNGTTYGLRNASPSDAAVAWNAARSAILQSVSVATKTITASTSPERMSAGYWNAVSEFLRSAAGVSITANVISTATAPA
jgi:hypothetical protein